MARRASPHRGPCRTESIRYGVSPGSGWSDSVMSKSEFRNYHEREVARLRSLLAVATTPALRARLLEQAQEHQRLAEELEQVKAEAEA
jgi:hypothetical protein